MFTECQDLIKQCLQIRPGDRPRLEDILKHPWFSCHLEEEVECCPEVVGATPIPVVAADPCAPVMLPRHSSLGDTSFDEASTSSQGSI